MLGIAERQRPQKEPVHQAEHRRVCARPEGQSEDGHQRESRVPRERAQSKTKIPCEMIQPPGSPHIADLLFEHLLVAKLESRSAAGVLAVHATAYVLRGHLFNMELQFRVELTFNTPSSE